MFLHIKRSPDKIWNYTFRRSYPAKYANLMNYHDRWYVPHSVYTSARWWMFPWICQTVRMISSIFGEGQIGVIHTASYGKQQTSPWPVSEHIRKIITYVHPAIYLNLWVCICPLMFISSSFLLLRIFVTSPCMWVWHVSEHKCRFFSPRINDYIALILTYIFSLSETR